MIKIKRIMILLLVFSLLFSSVSFGNNPISVYVRNEKLILDVDPVLVSGRTLVPLRAIFESFGAEVTWNQDTKTAKGELEGTIIELQIDNEIARVNGKPVKLDVPAIIVKGRTMVPVRFISESLGATVNWNQYYKNVLIDSHEHFKVTRIIDGDTFVVDFNGTMETVRLVGIDVPESVHPDPSKNVLDTEEVVRFMETLSKYGLVGLEFDKQDRDQYGRLLAYAWIGSEMVNKNLLELGYAKVMTFPPNSKYLVDFMETQKIAFENKEGYWGSGDFTYDDFEYVGEFVIDKSKNLIGPIGNRETAVLKGSIKSDKYHKLEYTHTGQINDDNLIYFESLDHAMLNGYKPCGYCFK